MTCSRRRRGSSSVSTHRSPIVARLVITATGIALSIAFLPMLYNQAPVYDDEGSLLVTLREFLGRGSLYHHTSGYYGPFYYSVFGGLYRILHLEPTPFNGRLIVLVLTGAGAALFAATVYRITRSLAAAVLCEVATSCILIRIAGTEPMHPAALIVVLLGTLLYCLASNCIAPRSLLLVGAGFAAAALVMTKINVGIFAVGAVVIWLVVGSATTPLALRIVAMAGATVFPFVLMNQTITESWTAIYALAVGISLLLVCVVAIARVPLATNFEVIPFAAGAGATLVLSAIWPLVHGTSISEMVNGMLVRPMNQANVLTVPAVIRLSWPLLLITVAGVAFAALWRNPTVAGRPIKEAHWAFVLGATGLIVLGLGAVGGFLSWLPLVVLIPALGRFVDTDRNVLSLLVLSVAIAVLQALHAYPVAGSQTAWSTVAVAVPSAIAIGVGLQWSPDWNALAVGVRAATTVAFSVFLVIAAGLWPWGSWNDYLQNPKLDLPGTALVRLDARQVTTLQQLTRFLVRHCDTFYSAPPSDSLYIYTKLPPPTGLVIDWYGVLDTAEQLEISGQLGAAVGRGERVCIVREATGYPNWVASSTGRGPLGAEVAGFSQQIGVFANYSVWTNTR